MAQKYIIQAYLGPEGWSNIKDIGDDYQVVVPSGYDKIIYVGIQGLPGIRIGLGSNTKTNAVYLNGTGYFELDLENSGAFLSGIYINKEDFNIRASNNNSKAYLIIDCIAINDSTLKEEVQVSGEGGEV